MDTVIVTAIGSFAADIVIKSLRKNGFRVIGLDIYPKPWIADACNVDVFYRVPPASEEQAYLKAVTDICRKEEAKHIIPLTDVEIDVINNHRSVFEGMGVCVCASPEKTVALCRRKKQLHDFIENNIPGVRTIPTIYATDLNEPPFDYPMIAKPDNGRSSQGLYRIMDFADWTHFLAKEKKDEYILQPYIPGSIVTIDVVRDQDGTSAAVPRLELLRTLNGAGTSVMVFPDRDLEEQSGRIADALGIIGCVNFEFIRDETGTCYFVECNPRFSGGVEFSCIAGYDCIANHMRCFQGKKIDRYRQEKSVYIARKYKEYVTQISDDEGKENRETDQ